MTAVIETSEFPQADLVWEVAAVPDAIAQGLTTPGAIASYLGNKVRRQGQYYAQAAQTLGLIARNSASGELVLTPYGRAFISYDRVSKLRSLRRLVTEREPIRSLVIALRDAGQLSRNELAQRIQELTDLADSTAKRRAQTIELWLCTLGLATKNQNRLSYTSPTQLTAELERKRAA